MAAPKDLYLAVDRGDGTKPLTLPAAEIWKLSTYRYKFHQKDKGRPGRARPFRKSQLLKYEHLPAEVRSIICHYAFSNLAISGSNIFTFHANGRLHSSPYQTRSKTAMRPVNQVVFKVPQTISQLFVSKAFLSDAIPHFSRCANISVQLCSLDEVISSLNFHPTVRCLCLGIFAQATYMYTLLDDSNTSGNFVQNTATFYHLSDLFVDIYRRAVWVEDMDNVTPNARRVTNFPEDLSTSHEPVKVTSRLVKEFWNSNQTELPSGLKDDLEDWLLRQQVYRDLKHLWRAYDDGRFPCKPSMNLELKCGYDDDYDYLFVSLCQYLLVASSNEIVHQHLSRKLHLPRPL